ncbi:MAG: DNA replication/repair protein RecF [Clostridia bacterium]|nr:DNA replication/repair protein RecF [Clostridia bacterium]
MKASNLELYNFRNYEYENISFSDGVNIIHGENGMGKTNILEAVYYFSYGRSFRSGGKEVIKDGEKEARISLSFENSQRKLESDIKFLSGKRKEIYINEIELKKTSQLLGNFICVLFTPDEMGIIKGMPEVRRKFCDSSIMPLRPNYIKELIKYRNILAQKTALLKSRQYETLDIWNEKLAETGSRIMTLRESYIERINQKAREIQNEISGGKEELNLIYNPSVKLKENYLEKLTEYKEKEKENLFCMVGVHRDDIDIFINGKPAKNYASQGQIRTAVLSLKLAETEIIKEETGEYPVMLLDDILSELDKSRREFLISKIKGKQIIITCTDIENYFNDNVNIIEIKDGKNVSSYR